MDNYKLLQRLGKGAQGAVFLVEHREDKHHYVLKKVECNDESEANKAFKEAMALQELRHEFVCGYKEFFVTWDKEECAMFVCIVMDYYEMGDLAKIIKTKRAKNESLDEMILKKWLGQMVEALVFVHKKQVIHRDLKPSNIFITKALSITIGDFGVATVMGDARTRTRTTVGSMNWMAPEVMERPYDERSDVWSLGCIILELATCGFLDSVQISSSLFEIKQNPQCLEDILIELPNYKYSANLCQLIRTMLRRNFHQRPTAIELVAYPYVRECLLLLPTSKLVEKKKQQFQKYDPLPTNKGIGPVFLYMKNNFENEEAQKHVFKYLETNTKVAKFCLTINKSMKKQLVQTMESCLECSAIQLSGCRAVLNLIENGDQNEILYTTDMIKPILLAMRCHSTSYELQSTACSLLMALSADEDAAEVIGEAGGVQDILAVMRQFPSKAEICANCCATLWSLSVNESNARIVTEEKGLQDVCNAFEAHGSSTSLVEAACSAIWSLSLEDDNLGTLTDVAIPLVVDCMANHMSKMKVVKSALMALASIVTCAEECAYKVISPSKDVAGLQVILNAYNAHSREVDIAESLCSVILELSEYDDIVQELKIPSLKTVEILTTMRKRYPGNEEISGGTEMILSKLGSGKNISKRPMSSKARPRSAARNR